MGLMFDCGKNRFQGDASLFSQVCAFSCLLFCVLHGLCNGSDLFAYVAYHACNPTGFLFGAFGQTPNVCRNGAKAFAIFSCHSSLDGCIKCQTVCLMGNCSNDINNFVNLTRAFV